MAGLRDTIRTCVPSAGEAELDAMRTTIARLEAIEAFSKTEVLHKALEIAKDVANELWADLLTEVSDLRAEVARLRASKGAAESGGIALDVESRLFELAVDIVHAFERVIFEEPSTSTSADAQAVG